MKEHVTVIPADGIIIVNGMALPCEFSPHIRNLHAIQWHHGVGGIEINDNGFMSNREITCYETEVLPYVTIWQSVFDQMKSLQPEEEPQEETGWWKSVFRKLS